MAWLCVENTPRIDLFYLISTKRKSSAYVTRAFILANPPSRLQRLPPPRYQLHRLLCLHCPVALQLVPPKAPPKPAKSPAAHASASAPPIPPRPNSNSKPLPPVPQNVVDGRLCNIAYVFTLFRLYAKHPSPSRSHQSAFCHTFTRYVVYVVTIATHAL